MFIKKSLKVLIPLICILGLISAFFSSICIDYSINIIFISKNIDFKLSVFNILQRFISKDYNFVIDFGFSKNFAIVLLPYLFLIILAFSYFFLKEILANIFAVIIVVINLLIYWNLYNKITSALLSNELVKLGQQYLGIKLSDFIGIGIWIFLISNIVILILALLGLVFTIFDKKSIYKVQERYSEVFKLKKEIAIFEKISHNENVLKKGKIVGINGSYGTAEILLDNNEVVIGRDSEFSNLIINSPNISRKHCSIRYNEKNSEYIVIDYSKNGTYLQIGERLTRGKETVLKEGSYLYIVNTENVFKLE